MGEFVNYDVSKKQLICRGEWILARAESIQGELNQITWPTGSITIQGDAITQLDSAGAWLLLRGTKVQVKLQGFSERHQKSIDKIIEQFKSFNQLPEVNTLNAVAELGRFSLQEISEWRRYLNFIGALAFEGVRVFLNPRLWRFNAIVSVINKTGVQALPIVALLSFMIGIVMSYQMGNQLLKYGANIFIVDLLGLSILREFGPMLTAIMVAGRTGSAFAAQLGIMKLNQEIDALNTLGVTPAELLLLPRIIGLVITLPLLTIWADGFGVLGGMVMAHNVLDISWLEFLKRFQVNIPVRMLVIGICKAPVFALIIASIGCFQGMEVRGSSESVGMRTTKSVVLSIFFIIIVDAIFSVLLSEFDL